MPDWKEIVRERLAPLSLTAAAESSLAEEIAQDFEDRFREMCAGGTSPEAAYRRVLAELDDLEALRTGPAMRHVLPRHDPPPAGGPTAATFFEGLWKDFRFALRSMRRGPIFVVFVVLTLALGIGSNTTVFTLINTLILNPLPVSNPAGLAAMYAIDPQNVARANIPLPISYADWKDYQARNQVFTSLAAYTSPRPVSWSNQGATQSMFVEFVTANYFPTLGLAPIRGRFFAPEEDSSAGAHPVVVLNYATWQKLFGGSDDIVGRELRVNNVALTVIGVAPPHFIGVNSIFGPDLWTPASMAATLFPVQNQNLTTDRAKAAFLAVGRLKPGVSLEQAQANVGMVAAALARAYPATNEGHAASVRPLRDALLASAMGGPIVFGSIALAVVVGIVLLIACSNVANLLLARSAGRAQELAVRLTMGASRSRLVRQFLTESVVLALVSGAVGFFFAYAGLQVLFNQLPTAANFPQPKLDAAVFLFSLAVSLVTGFLFGAIPAWKASRADMAEALKEGARTAGRSRRRVTIGNTLLVGQVAFSFLLLVAAALFLRSIGRAYKIDPGFQTAHLAFFPTGPGQAGYTRSQTVEFYREVGGRVAALPGVESIGWSNNLPLWSRTAAGLQIEGREQRSRTDQIRTVLTTIDKDYFHTAGVALESGRAFSDADQETTLPVAIVNAKLAHDYWPAGALGKRIRLPGDTAMRVIVGVARTANYTGWGEPPQSCVYIPLTQNFQDAMMLYVRTKGDPQAAMEPVEREIHAVGASVLIMMPRTGPTLVDNGLFNARLGVGLLTTFGLLALALASIGLYGILAYSVNQRKREIGLRMALGATRGSVLALVLREGMSLVLVGVAIGFLGALGVGQLLSKMLFGVGANDPLSIGAAALTLSAVALLACYLPARWATRVDPLEALRQA